MSHNGNSLRFKYQANDRLHVKSVHVAYLTIDRLQCVCLLFVPSRTTFKGATFTSMYTSQFKWNAVTCEKWKKKLSCHSIANFRRRQPSFWRNITLTFVLIIQKSMGEVSINPSCTRKLVHYFEEKKEKIQSHFKYCLRLEFVAVYSVFYTRSSFLSLSTS